MKSRVNRWAPLRSASLRILVIATVAVIAIGDSLQPAQAGELEQSQSRLNKAYNDYYKALKNSPDPAKDSPALSKQILQPAQVDVSRAIRSQTQATIREINSKKRPLPPPLPNPKKISPKDSPWAKAGKLNGSSGPSNDVAATHHSSATDRGPSPAAVQSRGESPKIVLDGSHVPKELEFSGSGSK